MKKIFTAIFMATLLTTPVVQAQTAPVVIHADKQDETAIRQLINDYANALKSASPEATVALYTTDGVVVPPNAPIAVGKNAVLTNYQNTFKAIGLDLTFDVLEISVIDKTHAIVRSTSKGTITLNADKKQMQDNFRELFVMEKVNGTWKIARYMFNQDH